MIRRHTSLAGSVSAGRGFCDRRICRRDHKSPDHRKGVVGMAGTVARVTEISATAGSSFEDAVNVGVARANGSRPYWTIDQYER